MVSDLSDCLCGTDIRYVALFLCIYRPLEVIGHDGKAANITMVPGDLVLYESHSVLHGVRSSLNSIGEHAITCFWSSSYNCFRFVV
jgi:hypothetical protein